MVQVDTLEGIIDNVVDYHYDFFADVLYLRLLSDLQTPSVGQLTDSGDIELHAEADCRLIGITVVSWWKRFGQGSPPDSIAEIQKQIEPLAKKVAA